MSDTPRFQPWWGPRFQQPLMPVECNTRRKAASPGQGKTLARRKAASSVPLLSKKPAQWGRADLPTKMHLKHKLEKEGRDPLLRSLPHDERNLLALGLVHHADPSTTDMNQCYRDALRIAELESRGWNVYTVDDYHDESTASEGRHIRANWCSPKQLLEDVFCRWAHKKFGALVLDYFYLPGDTYLQRYMPPSLFQSLIPQLADPRTFGIRLFYLPNDPKGYVTRMLKLAEKELAEAGLVWDLLENPYDNPLYSATAEHSVDKVLSSLPNPRHNGNMGIYTKQEEPFVRLRYVGR